MNVFTSDFTYRLHELGIDGYGVDVDKVMEALHRFKEIGHKRVEYTLPEYTKLKSMYMSDFVTSKHTKPISYSKGKRKLFDNLEKTVRLFDIEYFTYGTTLEKLASFRLFDGWVTAHVNNVLNRVYGLNLPEIESFLKTHDGDFDVCIESVYRGLDVPDAENMFEIAVRGEERRLGRELTAEERENTRIKFHRSTDTELEEIKSEIFTEIETEWNAFRRRSVESILDGR